MKQNNKYSKKKKQVLAKIKTQMRMYSAKPKLISKKQEKQIIYKVHRSPFLPKQSTNLIRIYRQKSLLHLTFQLPLFTRCKSNKTDKNS